MSLVSWSPSIKTMRLLRYWAVSIAEGEKLEVVTKRPFGRLVAVEAAEKIPYRAGANVIADGIALGLNVNAIKSKGVLVNHAINSVVAAAAKRAASVGDGTAETHAQKQIDDKPLKEIRRRAANAIKQFLRKRSVYLTMRRSHCFVGRLRLVHKFGRCRVLIVRRLLVDRRLNFSNSSNWLRKLVSMRAGFPAMTCWPRGVILK